MASLVLDFGVFGDLGDLVLCELDITFCIDGKKDIILECTLYHNIIITMQNNGMRIRITIITRVFTSLPFVAFVDISNDVCVVLYAGSITAASFIIVDGANDGLGLGYCVGLLVVGLLVVGLVVGSVVGSGIYGVQSLVIQTAPPYDPISPV